MNMVSMNIGKEGKIQRYLPLEIRLQMYEDVIELRKKGLSYRQIQKRIYEEYGVQLPFRQINFWVNKRHQPLGKVNKFDEKPSPELAYIIGTILSDGDLHKQPLYHCLRLRVKDKEFAEEFGKCSAKVLKKDKPYKPFWSESEKKWAVEVYSILLYKFLDRPLEELKPYIEYSKKTVSAFLRALFDGEGCMYIKRYSKCYIKTLRLFNTNEELLNYTKFLLKKYFDINTAGPNLDQKSGRVIRFSNNIITKTTKNCYYLHICTKNLSNFYKYIGFTIRRKKRKLIKAIKQ